VEKGETLLAKVLPRESPAAQAQQQQPNNPPPEEPVRKRPRSVAEAMANKGLIQGPKMIQHGGARIALAEGLDVKATPFGAYDAMFIEAVLSAVKLAGWWSNSNCTRTAGSRICAWSRRV
jgi:hypothetical protein